MSVDNKGAILNFKSVKWNLLLILKARGMQKKGAVQQYIDSECLKLSEPYIPKDTGALIQSGIEYTDIGSGLIRWNTPYARRWYYEPANFQGSPQRGNYWFERMKRDYKRQILSGAAKIAKAKTK